MLIRLHIVIAKTNNTGCTNKKLQNKDQSNANTLLIIIMSANYFYYVCEAETSETVSIK